MTKELNLPAGITTPEENDNEDWTNNIDDVHFEEDN